ncbi:protein prune homolog 2 [Colias croceus]|uniref:protein prune homolog 2 n=1 Tax=Colias crocea TaxID=72248 RepID=UPI001E280A27|nr:protein prune homolog 2 [Colias croceus]
MNNLKSPQHSRDDLLSSQSSDEKMDTGSESIQSQGTPNSNSSDFEDRDAEVLRLQNPYVQRSDPLDNRVQELSDSLLNRMSELSINSPDSRPRNLKISPPKLSSTLTLTTNHPLMGLGSPDDNYPDLIPKNSHKREEKDLSLSSIEGDKADINGYDFYSPQRNTSKSNLYISDNYVTAESHILTDSLNYSNGPRRKIIPRLSETPGKEGVVENRGMSSERVTIQSTPKYKIDMPESGSFHSGATEWCDSPSNLRSMPNFDLPIEMSSTIGVQNNLDSPDIISSTQDDKSAYQALLDPYTGSVALRPTAPRISGSPRRKIQVPPDEDSCSLDSVSGCSLESEDEPVMPEPVDFPSEQEDSKRSKSTATASECSDPIPEYSAAEEFRDERSWLHVKHSGGQATCDMKVIEPFKRVISHGGYCSDGAAIIVFSACHLPDNGRPDYRYVMDNLFLYVIWSLERLVTDEYRLVYLHGSAGRRRMPSFTWLHECYKLIDRRLRKSVKELYLVHPTFWLKSFVVITKPFVSSKFFRKLNYVKTLKELLEKVPVEPNAIPDIVKHFDAHKR